MVVITFTFVDTKIFSILIFFPMLHARGEGKVKREREVLKGQRRRAEWVR